MEHSLYWMSVVLYEWAQRASIRLPCQPLEGELRWKHGSADEISIHILMFHDLFGSKNGTTV